MGERPREVGSDPSDEAGAAPPGKVVEALSATPPDPQPLPVSDLLLTGDCEAVLPVGTSTQVHTIARFCLVEAVDKLGFAHPAVLPRSIAMPATALRLSRWHPDATDEKLRGGVALLNAWDGDVPRYQVVDLGDVDGFFDANQLRVHDGVERSVSFDGEEALEFFRRGEALVKADGLERPVLVRGQPGVRVDRSDGGRLQVTVKDVAALAADPRVRLPGEQNVRLEAAAIRKLLTTGQVVLRVGDVDVIVTTANYRRGGRTDDAYPDSDAFIETYDLPQEPPALKLAVYLPLKQTWELLGYSRGEVVANLSLAPQEETTVEVFKWDRMRRTRGTDYTLSSESTADTTVTGRDSRQVLNETTKDSSTQVQSNGSLSVDVKIIKFDFGADGDIREALRNVARSSTEQLTEIVERGSAKLAEQRHTKVEETEEFGREERTTRRLRNANMCHSLNLTYFEWLANYEVATEADENDVRLCVLIENPVEFYPYSRATLREYSDVLRPALLAPSLAEGFDAARLLDAHARLCHFACSRCTCQPLQPATVPQEQRQTRVRAAWSALCSSFYSLLLNSAGGPLLECFRTGKGNVMEAAFQFRAWLYERSIQRSAWAVWDYLLGLMPPDLRNLRAVASFYSPTPLQFLKSQPMPTFMYDESAGADLSQRLMLQASDALDPQTQFGVATSSPNALNGFIKEWADKKLSWVDDGDDFVKWLDRNALLTKFEDLGLASAVAGFVTAYNASTAQEPITDATPSESVHAEVGSVYSLQQLAEAAGREQVLMLHLYRNADYYKAVLWNALPSSERIKYLASYESVLRFIVPEALGHLGSQLAFALDSAAVDGLQKWFDDNVKHANGMASNKPVVRHVTLPTGELSLEGRLGQCGLCEDYIVDQRRLELLLKKAQADTARTEARQAQAELARRRARLQSDPPLLEDPNCCDQHMRVTIESVAPRPRSDASSPEE